MMTMETKNQSFAQFFGGKEPNAFIFEDEKCVVFEEPYNKQAPVHFLVVPKRKICRLMETSEADEQLLGHLLLVAKQVAINMALDRTGYHVMVDVNPRDSKFISLHVFGRALHHMIWPTGPGCRL